MSLKIAATVILYNPNESIITNIDSYAQYVSKLLIVDNSEVPNTQLIEKLARTHPNLEYIKNKSNLGIATALNIACDRAIELEMEWILTMDQDSKFLNFPKFLLCFTTITDIYINIGIITANHTGDITYTSNSTDCSLVEQDIVITSGNLVNLKYFNQIGRFNDKLFIDMVDYDFSHKVILNNLKILLLENHYILHYIGEAFQRKNILTGKIKSKIEHNPQRVYYMTRNRLYLSKIYSKSFFTEYNFLNTFNILFIHDIIKILLYEDEKFKKMYAKFLGLWHFLIGKYGKYII